jgi:uncharacterized protein YjbI with pentapeptide repeats
MTTREDLGTRRRPLLRPLLLAGVAVVLLVACVAVLPQLLVPVRTRPVDGVGAADRLRLENERIGLQNQARATLLQAFGGAFFLVTALLTWRQIQVNREGQITERFTRAIEHLGTADKLDVRLGGIYALERIAIDSRREQGPIVEILTAYVRGHATSAAAREEATVDPLRVRAVDVQAALTVLGRRATAAGDAQVMQLGGLDLRMATLVRADLRLADLSGTDLAGSSMEGTDLRDATLEQARLQGADLRRAKLGGARLAEAELEDAGLAAANLDGADLRRANLRAADLGDGTLVRADLREANLGEARLEGATLEGANLAGANLWKAKLGGADLRRADLTGSTLVQADLSGVNLDGATLEGANLVDAILDGTGLAGVRADRRTVWPAGFDAGSAGLRMTPLG